MVPAFANGFRRRTNYLIVKFGAAPPGERNGNRRKSLEYNWVSPCEVPCAPALPRSGLSGKCTGLGSLPTVRLERKLGRVPNDVLNKIETPLALDLEDWP
jgi:hypothetical protein